jgi:hypothetical protein
MNSVLVSHIRDIIRFRDVLCTISHVESEADMMKIWARWIITHRSLFSQKTVCLPEDYEYDPQLIVELIEKGVSTLHATYIHDWMYEEARIINKGFQWFSATAEFGGIHGHCPIIEEYKGNIVNLTCDDISVEIPLGVYNKLLKAMRKYMIPASISYIWFTCILYSLLDGKGLQWAVPQAVMNILRNKFGCDTELFASPINNYFSGYYSLFPYDKVFGSRGNFFTAPDKDFLSGTFQVNPPFIDCLFTKTTQRILKLLHKAEENGRDLTFIYIMPQWEDFNAYEQSVASPYCVKQIILWPNTHYYYQHVTNSYVRARFGTFILFLSTNPNCCDNATESEIVSAFSTNTYRKNY